ncbi:Heat shock factor protein [Psilocybe cubensis]|nr:Heat shock factor protein [Psilocybe cubensis]KAH9484583.1 Heat shock factor protein [Psilocybe cubensis]
MVNDPNNAELIRWSDAGDSFFVLDHERFAHEVLGRWFKHRNFSSFVRQLNMYGFHKIPHLQQGVLKSDTETEFWNFAHANFHRGQPDLLCLIQRKKQPQQGEDGAIDLRDASANAGLLGAPVQSAAGTASTNPPQANATLSSGQVLDVNSIVNGIAAIKRHQTTISAELNELKRSNQMLWQDAIAARERHQKQQDVINRILKFLAGVFGNHGASGGSGGGVATASPSPGTRGEGDGQNLGMARRRMRLMIEDAKRDGPKKSMVEELTSMDEFDSSYPTIETPISIASPAPSVAMSDRITVTDASAAPSVDSSSSSASETTLPSQQPEHENQISRSVTPVRHNNPSFEFDPRLHGVLNQFTPAQLQQLLASLASQPPLSDPTPSSSNTSTSTINQSNNMAGLVTPYLQPSLFDFSINPSSTTNNQPTFANVSQPTGSVDGLIPFDQFAPGPSTTSQNTNNSVSNPHQIHEERMERQWQVAEDIDKDVNDLNTSINSLIQTFGLDPSLLENPEMVTPGQDMDDNMQGTGANGSTAPSDFDFDSFFNHLSSGSGTNGMDMTPDNPMTGGVDYNDMASTAFLDEVQTPSSDMTASPIQPLRQVSPGINLDIPANDVNVSSTGLHPSTNTSSKQFNLNLNANTAAVGRKRKSEIDFDALDDAMDGQQAAAAATTTTTSKVAAVTGGPAKSKRRKDK